MKAEGVEFAGFLVHLDEKELHITDPQGTWIIQRSDTYKFEKWDKEQVMCVPELLEQIDTSVPCIVGVRVGATIHELRPWKIEPTPDGLGGDAMRQAMETIFTLGGEPLPIGIETFAGESRLAILERAYSRRLGFFPDICNDPRANPRNEVAAGVSKTIVVSDGYTDVDEGF